MNVHARDFRLMPADMLCTSNMASVLCEPCQEPAAAAAEAYACYAMHAELAGGRQLK